MLGAKCLPINRTHSWRHHVYHCCLCFEPGVLSQGQSKSCRSRCSYSARGRLSRLSCTASVRPCRLCFLRIKFHGYRNPPLSIAAFINRLRGLSLRLRQQGFETNLLQKSFNKFFSRHGLIVEKYGAALREMRLAIQAWIAPSYPYITYLLHSVVFQLHLGTCARTILFWGRALFVYLFNWRVHLVRLLTS